VIRKRYLEPLRTQLDAEEWRLAEAAGDEMALDTVVAAALEPSLFTSESPVVR
jgi:hypothetical protein